MNTSDIETRLKHAAAVATAPRSVVDDVMRQLPVSLPQPAPRSRWRRPVLAAGLAAPTVIAATLVFLFLLSGTAVRLTPGRRSSRGRTASVGPYPVRRRPVQRNLDQSANRRKIHHADRRRCRLHQSPNQHPSLVFEERRRDPSRTHPLIYSPGKSPPPGLREPPGSRSSLP